MAAGRKKQFDADLFRKLVRLFDSDREGERDVAMRQALQHCADCDPPLRFCDAVALAFGEDGASDDRVAELQGRIDRLENENTQLSEGVTALREELEGRGAGRKRRKGAGFGGLLADAWSFAQCRLLMLATVLAVRLLLLMFLDAGLSPRRTWWVNRIFIALAALLFMKWSGAQYEQSGVGPVFMKWIVFAGLSVVALAFFFGGWRWQNWFDVSYVKYPGAAFGILLAAVVLVTSNFTERLTDKACTSDSRPFLFLRSWFL